MPLSDRDVSYLIDMLACCEKRVWQISRTNVPSLARELSGNPEVWESHERLEKDL